MELKLEHRVTQSADNLKAFENGVENEIRRSRLLMGTPGIVSADGEDVDTDTAACAVSINTSDSTAIDVGAGLVTFPNGEAVEVRSADIQGKVVSTTFTDAVVVRLQYGTVADGEPVTNPYDNFRTNPRVRMKTPSEMLVLETVTTYNAQPTSIKDISVVLGVVRYQDGELTVDNGRDTYSWSRPWSTPVDVEHRSKVGSGPVTDTNPHGTELGDLGVGDYTAWQALVGTVAAIGARPTGFGRIPGTICSEVIPSGSFILDATGLVTGKAGARYAPLGFWPERLLMARLTDLTEVSGWVPKGRNVVAVYDPVEFAAAADLEVFYTKVTAASLPGSTAGLTTVTVEDPVENEIIVAGGKFFQTLGERNAVFTDVGLIPMKFDILIDGTGKVYKSPEVIYCNTKLDTLGAAPVPFTIQPRVPSRLRVGLSNYSPGFTEVRLQFTGEDANGNAITEQLTFTGPLPAPALSYTEVEDQRLFSLNVFGTVTQMQALVRNGDGPNTTVTVFGEHSPQQHGQQDDLLVATVQWTGSEVTANYALDPNVCLDRRLVRRGGGTHGVSPMALTLNQPGLVDNSVLGAAPTGSTIWATVVEDFDDPMWIAYPQADLATTDSKPIELPGQSLGAPFGYQSRKISFANAFTTASLEALWVRMLPTSQFHFPSAVSDFQVELTLYDTAGGTTVRTGTLTNPFPPYQVVFGGGALPAVSWCAASIRIPRLLDVAGKFQGFVLHIRA